MHPAIRTAKRSSRYVGRRSGGLGGSGGRRGAQESCPQVSQRSPRLAKHCDHGCSHFSVLLQTSHIGVPRLA
jgi:hypothetical protein